MKEHFSFAETTIVHFTDACLVAKPLNRSKLRVTFLLLFTYKLFCYHAN